MVLLGGGADLGAVGRKARVNARVAEPAVSHAATPSARRGDSRRSASPRYGLGVIGVGAASLAFGLPHCLPSLVFNESKLLAACPWSGDSVCPPGVWLTCRAWKSSVLPRNARGPAEGALPRRERLKIAMTSTGAGGDQRRALPGSAF